MTCGSPYPRVAAEMLACGVRWGWQCWERAGCAPAAGSASWPICLQALATAPEQFSYLEAHFYNSTAPGFFFFKYRESVCCRTHGSFLLRAVLCRGKICRAGPLSFSSSSSTPSGSACFRKCHLRCWQGAPNTWFSSGIAPASQPPPNCFLLAQHCHLHAASFEASAFLLLPGSSFWDCLYIPHVYLPTNHIWLQWC